MIPEEYSNAGGCGVLHPFNAAKREECEKRRAANKSQSAKSKQADADLLLAQAAALKASQPEQNTSWSAMQVAGVVIASMAAITIMVIVIKKVRSK